MSSVGGLFFVVNCDDCTASLSPTFKMHQDLRLLETEDHPFGTDMRNNCVCSGGGEIGVLYLTASQASQTTSVEGSLLEDIIFLFR